MPTSAEDATVVALAPEHDVVTRDGIAESPRHTRDRLLERPIRERLDLAAVLADDVVVMVRADDRRLEARDAVADVDALDEPELGQEVEDPVDARDPDRAAASA